MARSAAAAGAAAAAAAAGAAAQARGEALSEERPQRRRLRRSESKVEFKSETKAESKGSLRVRDPGLLRLPSSQSTEAPSSKSISVVAPSPDGGGAYLFSLGESRAFGARRQSSSLSSYPSFGLSSSGQGSEIGGTQGMFFTADEQARSGLFSDNETSGGDSSSSDPLEVAMTAAAAAAAVPLSAEGGGAAAGPVAVSRVPQPSESKAGGNIEAVADAGSSTTDSSSQASAAARRGSGRQDVIPIADQLYISQVPSTAGPAPVTPSAAPGGGNLFALVPAQVEHQRRARASRAASVGLGLGGLAGRGRKQSASRDQPSAFGRSSSSGRGDVEQSYNDDSDLEEKPRDLAARQLGAKASAGTGARSSSKSVFRRAAATIVRAATGRSSSGERSGSASTGARGASAASAASGGSGSTHDRSRHESAASTTGGGAKRRLSGDVEMPTGEPEAKKLMAKAQAGEGAGGDAGAAASGGDSRLSSDEYERVDSIGTKITGPPILQRVATDDPEIRIEDDDDSDEY